MINEIKTKRALSILEEQEPIELKFSEYFEKEFIKEKYYEEI